MVGVFKQPLTAAEIKAKAKALGADLVGIADGAVLDAHPPDPRDPRRPSDITDHDGGRVIVLAKKLSSGVARIAAWGDRHKYYNDELALTALEEASLELVYWLEDCGYPAIIVPPTHVDPWRYKGDPREHQTTLLSLPHAAVEAGLGTLGLNLQLLTPEYGPRVLLTAVLCSVDVECDRPMAQALCLGPVVRALPQGLPRRRRAPLGARLGDLRRVPLAVRLREAHRATSSKIVQADDAQARKELLRSEATLQPVAEHPARRRA